MWRIIRHGPRACAVFRLASAVVNQNPARLKYHFKLWKCLIFNCSQLFSLVTWMVWVTMHVTLTSRKTLPPLSTDWRANVQCFWCFDDPYFKYYLINRAVAPAGGGGVGVGGVGGKWHTQYNIYFQSANRALVDKIEPQLANKPPKSSHQSSLVMFMSKGNLIYWLHFSEIIVHNYSH